jgi:hypothetical protein
LESAILASGVLGEAILESSRPILRAHASSAKAEAKDVSVQPQAQDLIAEPARTINKTEPVSLDAINGLFAPKAQTFAALSETGVPSGFKDPVGGDMPYDGRTPPYTFYGGDFDGVNGLTSEKGTLVSEASTWDDVRIRNGFGAEKAFGHFLIDNVGGGVPLPTTANFYLRGPGVMSTGNNCLSASELINQQNVPATATLVDPGPYFGIYEVYRIEATLAPTSVPGPGHFYISLQPNGSGQGQFYIGTTSGANGSGQPIGNGDTWLTSSHFGIPCSNWESLLGTGPWDVSVGLSGTI